MDPWLLFVLCIPWLGLWAYAVLAVRKPPTLPAAGRRSEGKAVAPAGGEADGDRTPPPVSVIVPARNEARNIGRCVTSLLGSGYPDFEVIVVDDRSDDGTAAVARGAASGLGGEAGGRLRVVEGDPLPEGWFGKQWACRQGAERAAGDLLLFTDADTVHGPDLLPRAVGELERTGADLLSVAGRQIMDTFWEKLVQPQVFTVMGMRYPRTGRVLPADRWRQAIANGQFLLFRRDAYRDVGGHDAVRYEAAEDLRLAQRVVRSGMKLVVRVAEDALAVRMYSGLREIVAGWSKNMMQAGLQTLPPALRGVAPAIMLLSGIGLWLLPPAALLLAVAGVGGPLLAWWSALTTALNVLFWTAAARAFGAPLWTGPLYVVGAVVGHWILLRSWLGKGRVEWKGRGYDWDVYSDVREEV